MLKGSTLLKLVQCLVSECFERKSNIMKTKEACQCLGLIGVRDFGSVSLIPPNPLGTTCTYYK